MLHSFRAWPNDVRTTTARKNPIKWWQEDGVDSYDAADMETSSMISSEGRSTANGR